MPYECSLIYRLLCGPVIVHFWIGCASHLVGINFLPSRVSEKPVQTELCCCCVFYGSGQVVESLYGSCVLHACIETRQYFVAAESTPSRMLLVDAMVFSVNSNTLWYSLFLASIFQQMGC